MDHDGPGEIFTLERNVAMTNKEREPKEFAEMDCSKELHLDSAIECLRQFVPKSVQQFVEG